MIRQMRWMTGLAAVVILVILVSLIVGTVQIQFSDLWVTHSLSYQLVWQVRFPRILAACVTGAALALAGAMFQGTLQNPLADPFILGVSAGAGLGVTLAVFFGFSRISVFFIPLAAFFGALITIFLVWGIVRASRQTSPVTYLLAGITVNAGISAVSMLFWFSNGHEWFGVMSWLIGDLGKAPLPLTLSIGGFLLIISAPLWWLGRQLNMLALGDDTALATGVSVSWVRFGGFLAGSILAGLAVSLGGMIGFVGLMVPHFIRLMFRDDFQWLLLSSALLGAGFLCLTDTVARIAVTTMELPVGVITSLTGAPFFLWLLIRNRSEGGHVSEKTPVRLCDPERQVCPAGAGILSCQAISFGYSEKTIIKAMTLSVFQGEWVGLVGSNGAGKSTLARLLVGILTPDQGEIIISGQIQSRFSRRALAYEVAWVPPAVSIVFRYRVRDIIAMGRYAYVAMLGQLSHADHDIIYQAAVFTDVADLLDRFFDTLSSGEQQRVLLARAFAQQAKILVLDEPFSHLDYKHQLNCLRLLQARKLADRLTVLWVSHQLSLVKAYCSRVVALKSGAIIADGEPEMVLSDIRMDQIY